MKPQAPFAAAMRVQNAIMDRIEAIVEARGPSAAVPAKR
jgi:hypothetical protein